MNTNNINCLTWKVECLDGVHDITVHQNTSGTVGYKLYIDNQPVQKLTPTRKGIIMSLEYTFECGGEMLTLVGYGSKIDLVYRGQMQNSKIPYEPENVLPFSYRSALLVLNMLSLLFYIGVDFTSPTIVFRLFLSVIMLLSSSVVIILNSNSPFLSKKKKIAYSLLILLLSVLVVSFFALLNVFLGSAI